MSSIRNAALILIALLFCSSLEAEILKVKGNQVMIRLDGKKVSVGEQLDVIDATGTKKGVVEIITYDDTKAYARIESGTVSVGMKLARRIASTTDRFDFRVNPIGLIGGSIDANLDFRISQDWTVGVQGIYLHVKLDPSSIFTSDYNITAYGFGTRANYFFNGAFKDGWYFGPSLEYLSVGIKTGDAAGPASGTASGLMASALVGYGWFWDGFNLMLGGGYAAVLGTSSITIKDSVGNEETITANLSGLTYELSIGWTF
jgi:hypothetical protein